jgi:hypothetical protein
LVKDFENENKGSRHKFISENGRYIYHVAIIDYLQAYDLEKKAENFLKIWLYQRDGKLISACHPTVYAGRFHDFMKTHVVINGKNRHVDNGILKAIMNRRFQYKVDPKFE